MSKFTTNTSENRVSTLAYQAEAARAHRAYTVKYAFQKLEMHLKDQPFQTSTEQYSNQYAGQSTNTLGVKVVQKLESASDQPIIFTNNPESTVSTINPAHGNRYESSETPLQPVEAPAEAIETPVQAEASEILDQAEAIASARRAIDEIPDNPLFKLNNG